MRTQAPRRGGLRVAETIYLTWVVGVAISTLREAIEEYGTFINQMFIRRELPVCDNCDVNQKQIKTQKTLQTERGSLFTMPLFESQLEVRWETILCLV